MRLVVASLTGLFMALYFMYFFFPMLTIEHANVAGFVNGSDTTIAQANALGSGFYMVLPLIPVLIIGFAIISYALKRDIGD